MKKKLVASCLILAMSATLFAGCGNKSEEAGGESDGQVTIQFMHQQVEEERLSVVDQIISEFEEANPNVKVESMPVNEDDFDQKITTLAGSSELPAVIEFSQDQAKTSVTNQLLDTAAMNEVISTKGEDAFFEGALDVVKTEDGADYVGVPLCGWVQGIWCNTAMLESKGFSLPESWDDVRAIAEAFYDPANQSYGIALPTSDSAFTEQVFSQFALSNGANVFDADGNVTIDTDAMKEAAEFYKELAGYSMPGSTEVADVKDAFVGQNAPMCMYSTYILGGCQEAGFLEDVQLALPTNTESAAYGCVTVLSISNQISAEESEAAKAFVSFMIEKEHNEEWITMAPGGVQPVFAEVAEDTAYTENEAIVPFAHLLENVGEAFDNLKLFGSVDGKNFMAMGDITNSGIISKALNNILVQDADIDAELATAQTSVEGLVK
ncbi:MAG: extracellular solute-binding protein [Eubacteriales bacterium]|nr:extracellular solute-binding protein [Eubacteriales bacterium]